MLIVTVLLVAAAATMGMRALDHNPQRAPAVRHPTSSSVVLVAAGDIACDPEYAAFRQGAGTAKACHERATSELIKRIAPRQVLALGDIQYVKGAAGKYLASYDPTWGRFKQITHPVLGNHEGGEGGTNRVYFDYFGGRAGDRSKGYYSYEVGSWHIIALNSNCGAYLFNGSRSDCRSGSAQDLWLKADLAAHAAPCTLAYFHVPRFSSGAVHHNSASTDHTLTALWQDLYAGGADVVLNGHDHNYERFAPMKPDGTADRAKGIREFVVGTGGDSLHAFSTIVSGSEVRNRDSFGVLKLTLSPTRYTWQFVNDGSPGATNSDRGSASCHR